MDREINSKHDKENMSRRKFVTDWTFMHFWTFMAQMWTKRGEATDCLGSNSAGNNNRLFHFWFFFILCSFALFLPLSPFLSLSSTFYPSNKIYSKLYVIVSAYFLLLFASLLLHRLSTISLFYRLLMIK